METRARYTLIGLFTLAVTGLGFAFVYWLNTGGGFGQRTTYRIIYDGPVPGLLKGSAVLFNGIRVGEVTSLDLDPVEPQRVSATVAIATGAPVRADTKAAIEFQGLTGAPAVALTGGAGTSPKLTVKAGEIPLLIAETGAGKGMTQAAREVMRNIDAVVTTNAEPLRSLIANIEKFSGALSRNSDRVDGIVAGLERLTGGGAKVHPRIYDLAAARWTERPKKIPAGQLIIPEPTALSVFDSDKIIVNGDGAEKPDTGEARWPDVLPKLIQTRLVQSFENAHYLRVLGRVPEGARADHQLLIDIRKFEFGAAPGRSAVVELAGKLITNDGNVVGARIFRAEASVSAFEPAAAAAALSTAFEQVAIELVQWTLATL